MQAIQACMAPKGMAFQPFWSETGYGFCTLVSLVSNVWKKLFLLLLYTP